MAIRAASWPSRSVQESCFGLAACADPDLAAAARVAALAGGAATFASVDEMLASGEVDVVFVATPHHVLYESSLAAIQAGKHVLAEKPIGMDEKEAAQLEEAVARSGVCFMTGYSFRYIAALQKVWELVQAGAVGEIHTITGSIGVGPMSSGWRAGPETGGGPLLYVGSHLVDAMLWYMQDEPVTGLCGCALSGGYPGRRDDDVSDSVCPGRGGSGDGDPDRQGSLLSAGPAWAARDASACAGWALPTRSMWKAAFCPPMPNRRRCVYPRYPTFGILMHTPQLAEFAAAIHEKRQPSVTVTDGRRVLRVLDGIIKSGRRGEPIRIGS